jgi:hypothetical protein
VKEIKDLFLPYRILLPTVLPWKSVNENILQLSQPNKGCGNEAPSIIVIKIRSVKEFVGILAVKKLSMRKKFHWL